jgi:hypothetical protein
MGNRLPFLSMHWDHEPQQIEDEHEIEDEDEMKRV